MSAERIRHAAPLAAYKVPAYPTHSQLQARPGFLLRHLPPRWRGDRLLLLLLTSSLPATQGCTEPALGVAPLSNHGYGVGSYGCMVITPPIFMSETEAMAVVKDELEAAGISGMAQGVTLDDVTVSGVAVEDCNPGIEPGDSSITFVADLYDEPKLLAIEVFTERDFTAMHRDAELVCETSVESIDLKRTALLLTQELEEKGQGRWYGVLYDPVPSASYDDLQACWDREDPDPCEDALMDKTREMGKRMLREQVRDLVVWMEGNGVL